MRINRLGETRLIRMISRQVKKRGNVRVGIGDDACVLTDGKTVLTTDSYAQGIHFDLSYMTYYQVGTRSACACLSDIIAMGAQPSVLLVAIALPPDTEEKNLRQFYQGMELVCAKLSCEIAGGDLIALDRFVVTLTAIGVTDKPLLRSGARPGDYLCLTGYAGLSETGRLLLRNREKVPKRAAAVHRHLLPLPRVKIMRKLQPGITALIDTSDGLATDIRHLAEMSRVRITIFPEKIPIHPATRALCRKHHRDPIKFSLTAGEDYELLFTTPFRPPATIDNIPVTVIGTIEKGSGVFLQKNQQLTPLTLTGYEHFLTPT